jgi:hypothetical protein
MLERFDKTWPFPNALFLAFSAKARAETAAGVGNETDITIIRPGGAYQANKTDLDAFRTIFSERRAHDKIANDESHQKVQVYIQKAEAKAQANAAQIAAVGDQGAGEIQDAAEPRSESDAQ